MNRSLRYISISHNKASVANRDIYHISSEQKERLEAVIRTSFTDIVGLFILVTCNRTEIYFESEKTTSIEVRDFLMQQHKKCPSEKTKQLFDTSDLTKETVFHLLEVSSGLTSSVLGDAEIIHQIKKAYQDTIAHKTQGSLLERAMQTIFKNHKRLSNETHFRDGTTSLAYKSLKVVTKVFNRSAERSEKILFIGAGDIIKQLFKYNTKFNFDNIYISNRTEEKAIFLSGKHDCEVYSWNKVLSNNFEDFDVIISATSNCRHLIKTLPTTSRKMLLIDLAIPENIDSSLANHENVIYYNLDSLSKELEETKERRLASIGRVSEIIAEGLSEFSLWLDEAPLRDLLGEYKILIDQKVKDSFDSNTDASDMKMIRNQVMRTLIKNPEVLTHSEKADSLITEQIAVLSTQYS